MVSVCRSRKPLPPGAWPWPSTPASPRSTANPARPMPPPAARSTLARSTRPGSVNWRSGGRAVSQSGADTPVRESPSGKPSARRSISKTRPSAQPQPRRRSDRSTIRTLRSKWRSCRASRSTPAELNPARLGRSAVQHAAVEPAADLGGSWSPSGSPTPSEGRAPPLTDRPTSSSPLPASGDFPDEYTNGNVGHGTARKPTPWQRLESGGRAHYEVGSDSKRLRQKGIGTAP